MLNGKTRLTINALQMLTCNILGDGLAKLGVKDATENLHVRLVVSLKYRL